MAQQFPLLLSTMNDVPGYRVVRVMGEVFGLTVRSRNAFSNMGAGFKAMAGGELKGLSKLLYESRQEALQRLCQEGLARGANAVIAMRFDCNEIGGTASVFYLPSKPDYAREAAYLPFDLLWLALGTVAIALAVFSGRIAGRLRR